MKRLQKWITVGILICFSGISQSGFSQEIKESAVGRLAVQLIENINTGKKESWNHFIHDQIDLNARDNNPEDLLKKFSDFYILTNGVEIISMEPGRGPDEVKLLVKSKKEGQSIEMFTRLSRESDKKLIGFIFQTLQNTKSKSQSGWPQSAVPEKECISEIENHVSKASGEDKYSGSLLVAKKDRVLFNKAYGIANQAKKIPNSIHTKFNLGSMNKMFTAVAIGQLVQDGKLAFTDTLLNIFPDYPDPAIAKKITISQLLTHTSGMGDFFNNEFFNHREKYISLSDYLSLFSHDSLQFEPGTNWSYSNAGFIVLGLIIEKISGENYYDYVRNHIFLPSGMKNTDAYRKDESVPDMAVGYTSENAEGKPLNSRKENTYSLPVRGSSAGGGYSTTGDLLLFSHALLSNRLLNPDFTKTIMTGKVDDHHPDSKYAFGFMDITRNGQHIIGHNGGGPGINGALYILPASGFIVIVLGNYGPPAAADLAMEISEFLAVQ